MVVTRVAVSGLGEVNGRQLVEVHWWAEDTRFGTITIACHPPFEVVKIDGEGLDKEAIRCVLSRLVDLAELIEYDPDELEP